MREGGFGMCRGRPPCFPSRETYVAARKGDKEATWRVARMGDMVSNED